MHWFTAVNWIGHCSAQNRKDNLLNLWGKIAQASLTLHLSFSVYGQLSDTTESPCA